MQIATVSQIREIENRAMAAGLSDERLMESAGAAAAQYIHKVSNKPQNAVVLCGNGNNGGDGFVIARLLQELQYTVTVILACGKPKSPTAKAAFEKLPAAVSCIRLSEETIFDAATEVSSAAIVVDAVYGIGFHGALPFDVARLFSLVTEAQLTFAVDLPSGMQADTHSMDPRTFKAKYTLTFIALKPALADEGSKTVCGHIEVLSIGTEPYAGADVLPQEHGIRMEDVRALFAPRKADSHKGTYGHLLTVCGSVGMAGAAILSAKAALRSGVGLLTVALPRSIYPIVAAAVPEAVFLPLDETKDGVLARTALKPLLSAVHGKDALLIGCGLGKGESVELLVCELIQNAQCPVVLDADGLNAVSLHIDVLKTAKTPLVLTPHPGEMARLCKTSVAAMQTDRTTIAWRFAEEYGVTLALKGHRTVVADGITLRVNGTGNPGMATGGSGDVLAGMIASLSAQGMRPFDATMSGVFLHGKAGDQAAKKMSQHAMLPSDIIEELSGLFLELE